MLLLVCERIGRTVGIALVEPEPIALRIGLGRLGEAWLVGQTEVIPSVVTAEFQPGIRGEDLQQIERAVGQVCQFVPQTVVAAGPHQPHVAALDLVGGQRDTAVHGPEVILVGRGKRLCGASRLPRLVDDCLCARLFCDPGAR
jgi:hypothetical protein